MKESKKRSKEGERILRMKNKPLSSKVTDQDVPKFKSGKRWRSENSSYRIKKAIERNKQYNK
jgi:hypothetical protein